jgi:hypothetical protein
MAASKAGEQLAAAGSMGVPRWWRSGSRRLSNLPNQWSRRPSPHKGNKAGLR